jgi:hypothetical protein
MLSICSRLIRTSCIPALLSSKRLESDALETRDLGLEEAKVHERRTTEVLALDVPYAGTVNREDRHSLAVRAPDQDLTKLAASQKAEGAQE